MAKSPKNTPEKKPRSPWFWVLIIIGVLCLFPIIIVMRQPAPLPAYPAYHGEPIIAIDLGTSYSSVGVPRGKDVVEILANEHGHKTTPSWVSFTNGEPLIGEAAKNASISNPENTVFDFKNLLGRKMDDPEVQAHMQHWPFKLVEKRGKPSIRVKSKGGFKEFTPEEITAMLFRNLKAIAENHLGQGVTYAVVSVPAYFNDAQRQAVKDAGTIAGLTILRVVNESAAAVVALGIEKQVSEGYVLVYHLGGATLDVSLLELEDGVIDVLAIARDGHLGGHDFDNRLVDYFVHRYQTGAGSGVIPNRGEMEQLRREVEIAKERLYTYNKESVKVHIKNFQDGKDLDDILTREIFEELNMDLFKKTMESVEQVLVEANIKKENVEYIVLEGGSTRIPRIRSMLQEYFGKNCTQELDPDETVVSGIARQAGIVSYYDNNYCDLPIASAPLSLGIETTGGVFTKIIPINTVIPTIKRRTFTTAVDDQSVIRIRVFAGDKAMVKDNTFLGSFDIEDVPPAKRGIPQIEVALELNPDYILSVTTAWDTRTGKNSKAMIYDISKLIEDREYVQGGIEISDPLSEFISSFQAQLHGPMGRKLSSEDKSLILTVLNQTSNWINTSGSTASPHEIHEKVTELQEIVPDEFKSYSVARLPQKQVPSHQEL